MPLPKLSDNEPGSELDLDFSTCDFANASTSCHWVLSMMTSDVMMMRLSPSSLLNWVLVIILFIDPVDKLSFRQ
jgi:hypothetical protein